MSNDHIHESHPDIVKRLKRAEGHLHRVIEMFGEGRACLDLTQQLHAVEKAISEAKKTLIHDHVDHCLDIAANGGSAKSTKNVLAEFKAISAVLSGLPEVRQVLAEAAHRFDGGRRTVLFVDEVHRFNKTQQDAFLPHIERGTIVFVGATTENPSFELNSALLSRCRVHVMEAVSPDDIVETLRRALETQTRACRGLEEQCADGGAGEPTARCVVVEPRLRMVEQRFEHRTRQAVEREQVAQTAGGIDLRGRIGNGHHDDGQPRDAHCPAPGPGTASTGLHRRGVVR